MFLSFLDLILGGVFIAIGLIVLLDWQITDIVAWLPFVVVGGLLVFTTFLRSAARPQPCTRRRLRGGSPHACARVQRVRRLRREMLHLLHQGVGAARAAHLPAGVRCVRARLRRPPCRRAPALPAAGEHQRTLTLNDARIAALALAILLDWSQVEKILDKEIGRMDNASSVSRPALSARAARARGAPTSADARELLGRPLASW